MELPGCLNKAGALLVLDASVVINLIATGCGTDIIQALPRQAVVVDIVLDEIESGRASGRRDADDLAGLISTKVVRVVSLTEFDSENFEKLVAGPSSQTLDDGEAATIAFSQGCGGVAVIDERKATRLCGEIFPSLRLGNTIDLLSHPDVLVNLGRQKLSAAVLNSLMKARMRVPRESVNWVVDLIGQHQAVMCPSLPGFVRNSA